MQPPRPDILRRAAFAWIILAAAIWAQHLRCQTAVGLTAGTGLAFGDDVINIWAGARLALHGRLATVYDIPAFHQFQIAALGGPIHWYCYIYPPPALLLTLPLGLLPYPAAVAAWWAGGIAAFIATVRMAWPGASRRDAALYALAMPAVLACALAGQTGLWAAAMLGGGLMLTQCRPLLGGALLGLLIAKPQLSLLVPIALIAGQHWRPLAAAAATATTLAAATLLLWGFAPWHDFARQIALLRGPILEDGAGVWPLFTSVFVLIRHLPAKLPIAYAAQAAASLLAAGLVVRVWRSPARHAHKCALLSVAGIFTTPYVQMYDLPIVALVPLWLLPDRPAPVALTLLIAAPILSPWLSVTTGTAIGCLLLLPAAGSVVAHARRTRYPPVARLKVRWP